MPIWEKIWKLSKLALMSGILEYMFCRALYVSAKKDDWFWVWAAVFELQLFAAYFGWMLIEDFNTYQRRKRLEKKG